jgi:signal transduction histidine kinase
MLDRLAEIQERQRAFVADAAHELRSPLASIQAQLEVAQWMDEGGTLPADLMVDVKRLSGLVEDLLILARADADTRPPPRLAAVDAVILWQS